MKVLSPEQRSNYENNLNSNVQGPNKQIKMLSNRHNWIHNKAVGTADKMKI